MRIAFKLLDRSAVGECCAFRHVPDVAASEVVGVRQFDAQLDGDVFDDDDVGALFSHAEHGHDVHDEYWIGAAAHAVDGEGDVVVARFVVFVCRVGFARRRAVAKVPMHGALLRRCVGELQCRNIVEIGGVFVAFNSKGEVDVFAGEVFVVGLALHASRGY